jgi:Transglycosylase SLT domain
MFLILSFLIVQSSLQPDSFCNLTTKECPKVSPIDRDHSYTITKGDTAFALARGICVEFNLPKEKLGEIVKGINSFNGGSDLSLGQVIDIPSLVKELGLSSEKKVITHSHKEEPPKEKFKYSLPTKKVDPSILAMPEVKVDISSAVADFILAESAIKNDTFVGPIQPGTPEHEIVLYREAVSNFAFPFDKRMSSPEVAELSRFVSEKLEKEGKTFPASIMVGMAFTESTFNPNAVGADNDIGLLQMLPDTAREIWKREGLATEFGPFKEEYLKIPLVSGYLSGVYLTDNERVIRQWYDEQSGNPEGPSLPRWKDAIASYNRGLNGWLGVLENSSNPEVEADNLAYVVKTLKYIDDHSYNFENDQEQLVAFNR